MKKKILAIVMAIVMIGSCLVMNASAMKVCIERSSEKSSIFTFLVYGVDSEKVSSVRFPILKPGANGHTHYRDDGPLYGTYIGNGTWACSYDVTNQPGDYRIDIWWYHKSGAPGGHLGEFNINVPKDFLKISNRAYAVSNPTNVSTFTVIVEGVSDGNDVYSVKFPTFAPNVTGAKWCDANNIGSNTWALTFNTTITGDYDTHIYKYRRSVPGDLWVDRVIYKFADPEVIKLRDQLKQQQTLMAEKESVNDNLKLQIANLNDLIKNIQEKLKCSESDNENFKVINDELTKQIKMLINPLDSEVEDSIETIEKTE